MLKSDMLRSWGVRVGIVLLVALFMGVSLVGCPRETGEGEGEGEGEITEGEGEGEQEPGAIVKTQIRVAVSGKIDVGDDLIVYGLDDNDEPVYSGDHEPGIFYFTPSQVDNTLATGTLIANSDQLFDTLTFKVAGKKIALVRSTSTVTIFDTTTAASVDIPPGQVTLESYSPVDMVSDGNLIATVNDRDEVNDEIAIKLIDVSGDTPVVTSFTEPAKSVQTWDQLAIDADANRLVALGDGDLYVFDIASPATPPAMYDYGLNSDLGIISEQVQIQLDGDYVIYHDTEDFDPEVSVLNVANGTVATFDYNETQTHAPVAVAGGSFAFFLNFENADQEEGTNDSYRSVIGSVANPASAVLAAQFDEYDWRDTVLTWGSFDQEQCLGDDRKNIGYGSMCCITPDGSRWFLSGYSWIDDTDYLQMSTGGAFEDFADPEGSTRTGSVMASDIVCSDTTVAFRALREEDDPNSEDHCGADEETVLGFLVIDRLEEEE